jgi:hypothetical protein
MKLFAAQMDSSLHPEALSLKDYDFIKNIPIAIGTNKEHRTRNFEVSQLLISTFYLPADFAEKR